MAPDAATLSKHVRVLAIVTTILGAFWLLAAFATLLGLTFASAWIDAAAGSETTRGALAGLGTAAFIVVAVVAIPAVYGGMMLARGQDPGRRITLVVAVPALLWFPIGTLYAAYAFWVLTRPGIASILRIHQETVQ